MTRKPCKLGKCEEPSLKDKERKCPKCGWYVPTQEERRINLENNLDFFLN